MHGLMGCVVCGVVPPSVLMMTTYSPRAANCKKGRPPKSTTPNFYAQTTETPRSVQPWLNTAYREIEYSALP